MFKVQSTPAINTYQDILEAKELEEMSPSNTQYHHVMRCLHSTLAPVSQPKVYFLLLLLLLICQIARVLTV